MGDEEASVCGEALEDGGAEGEVRRATAGGEVELALCWHWTGIGGGGKVSSDPESFTNFWVVVVQYGI